MKKIKYALFGVLSAIYMGLRLHNETIFSGTFKNEAKYVYRESVLNYNPFNGFTENQLILYKGNTIYTFIDKKDEKSIDWKDNISPEINDKLEEVIIKDKNGKRKYNLEGGISQFEEFKSDNILKISNLIYNKIRYDIRKRIREVRNIK